LVWGGGLLRLAKEERDRHCLPEPESGVRHRDEAPEKNHKKVSKSRD